MFSFIQANQPIQRHVLTRGHYLSANPVSQEHEKESHPETLADQHGEKDHDIPDLIAAAN